MNSHNKKQDVSNTLEQAPKIVKGRK